MTESFLRTATREQLCDYIEKNRQQIAKLRSALDRMALNKIPKDNLDQLMGDTLRSTLQRIVVGQLKSMINDHGNITLANIPSASKRVSGVLMEYLKRFGIEE